MGIRIKVIDGLLRFFSRVGKNIDSIIHDLKFMKYEILFGERDDDIYVATYLKSGTTWMQMILYQLTTNGDVDFNHIYDVSPWLRNMAETGKPVPDLPSPRIIKTHDPYDKMSRFKKGRFIFVIRDGRDVALSLFHHRRNYIDSELSFAENFEMSFKDKDQMNWFEFNHLWLANKYKRPILYVRYEDLQKDLVRELFRISGFIGVELKHEDIPRIVERSSFAYMKAHEEKFGERPPEKKHEMVYNKFIREGKVGEGKSNMSEEELQFFNQQFNAYLAGFPLMRPYGETQRVEDI